jgi:hypothetical protein
MTDKFGSGSDDNSETQGTGFNTNTSDQDGSVSKVDITPEQLQALQTRDAAAQAHITKLEGENGTLRQTKETLANQLASAATIEDVISRMNDSAPDVTAPAELGADKVAELIDARLQQKTVEQVRDANWSNVETKLNEVYGEFTAANKAVEARAATLRMTTAEATELAMTNPTMFYELYLPKGSAAPQQSSSANALSNSQSQVPTTTEGTRDREYYKKLRQSNPNKYWSVEVQKQYRRDLHGET